MAQEKKETLRAMLKALQENNDRVKLRLASGKECEGNIEWLSTELLTLRRQIDTFISIDKIELVQKLSE
ncbi:hypothetical protein ES702_01114 [subsurface metagenome]